MTGVAPEKPAADPAIEESAIRRHFPALETSWALFDNAGGSAPARFVIDRVRDFMERVPVQLGASYRQSREAAELVADGRRALSIWLNAAPEEVVIGPSSTVLLQTLARALPWEAGDEVVVTELDHESNIGPWKRLEERGVRVRTWPFRADLGLHLDDLVPLLGERTRLVAFTHCSNLVGRVHDVASVAKLVREHGAETCVDGVAFAPHAAIDVASLGVDYYVASLYKVFGPHQAVLFGRRECLERTAGQYHYFHESAPSKLEPGNVNYELTASLPGMLEYFGSLVGVADWRELTRADLERAYARIARREEELARPLLSFLEEHPRVQLRGPGAEAGRVATISFTVDGLPSAALPPLLEERELAVRHGNFHARRAVEALGLDPADGVVRASLLHYNTHDEVNRLVSRLDEVL